MNKIVEMTLAFSKNLPDTLLYLLLTDPLTGELFKAGVVERRILDYTKKDYDIVSDPNYIAKEEYAYAKDFVINGDYLFFYYTKTKSWDTVGYDYYQVRINWITENNVIIGAYPNAIIHQAIALNPLIQYMHIIPTLTGCAGFDAKRESLALIDAYFNVGSYSPRNLDKFFEVYFNFVMTRQGLSLVYNASYHLLTQDTGTYLDPALLTIGYKNGDALTLAEKQIYRGEIPSPNDIRDINLAIEYAIKQNTPNYIAKLTTLGKHLVKSITDKECYLYQNGGNPTGWDRNIRHFHDDTYSDIATYNGLAPDVKALYPAFNLTNLALSSYQLYYSINQGFWKDHRYTEEISSD